MPETCQYREKPGLAPQCKVLPAAGEEMCPRHVFLDKQRQQVQLEKERIAVIQRKAKHGAIPQTRQMLIEQGYQYVGNGDCRDCGKSIEWWKTKNDRNSPWERMPDLSSPALSHFAGCTRSRSVKKHA